MTALLQLLEDFLSDARFGFRQLLRNPFVSVVCILTLALGIGANAAIFAALWMRFCAAALEEALLRFGKPRIFNTDQGSTFTAEAFVGKLAAAGVAISMDGRGRFMDNIFIERLWRSIKYEEVHLKAYADGREARASIGSWTTFYNFRRPHQAMNNQMPMAVWRAGMDKIEAAARAVDMPLRLDNANALPTYPQQKQKQQDAI